MQFEPLLVDNWNRLRSVLHDGQGSLLREQPPQEYQKRLELFQRAMGEAAAVRSRELWDAINLLPAEGTIIDIGAGDGAYLHEFLARWPGWRGIACDLADVCARSATSALPDNLTLFPCNILDEQELARLTGCRLNSGCGYQGEVL
jgi:hypothetical protein